MKVLFNYAEGCCLESQAAGKKSAEIFGGFDKVFCFSKRNMEEAYLKQNKFILKEGA